MRNHGVNGAEIRAGDVALHIPLAVRRHQAIEPDTAMSSLGSPAAGSTGRPPRSRRVPLPSGTDAGQRRVYLRRGTACCGPTAISKKGAESPTVAGAAERTRTALTVSPKEDDWSQPISLGLRCKAEQPAPGPPRPSGSRSAAAALGCPSARGVACVSAEEGAAKRTVRW